MAVQPYPYLAMTDGTTTVTFADGSGGVTSYPPLREGWAPSIAALRRSELGGVGPYEEVVEELEIIITGADTATALANLGALARLLDQAERWWLRGEAVSPVLLKYAPQGSTISSTAAPLQTVVLGRAEGDETNLNLTSRFNDVGMIKEIRTVHVRFLRRGWWIGADSSPATSASAANPTVHTVTFADNQLISSPAKVTIGGLTNAAGIGELSGFIAVADSASDMVLIDAESLAFPANNWTSVAEAAARGGNILRWARNTTTFTESASTGGTTVSARCYAVYATVRNNSATMSFLLRLSVKVGDYAFFGSVVPIDTSTTNPRALLLGVVVLPEFTNVLLHNFRIEAAQVDSGAGHTIDIDTLLVVNLDDEMSRVVAVGNYPRSVSVAILGIDDGILTRTLPAVGDISGVPVNRATYSGDPLICSKGTTMVGCLFATQGANWQIRNTTPAICSTTLTAVRHNAYLVPS